jgi:hypothetical protein
MDELELKKSLHSDSARLIIVSDELRTQFCWASVCFSLNSCGTLRYLLLGLSLQNVDRTSVPKTTCGLCPPTKIVALICYSSHTSQYLTAKMKFEKRRATNVVKTVPA